jgi:hypothetical protein
MVTLSFLRHDGLARLVRGCSTCANVCRAGDGHEAPPCAPYLEERGGALGMVPLAEFVKTGQGCRCSPWVFGDERLSVPGDSVRWRSVAVQNRYVAVVGPGVVPSSGSSSAATSTPADGAPALLLLLSPPCSPSSSLLARQASDWVGLPSGGGALGSLGFRGRGPYRGRGLGGCPDGLIRRR